MIAARRRAAEPAAQQPPPAAKRRCGASPTSAGHAESVGDHRAHAAELQPSPSGPDDFNAELMRRIATMITTPDGGVDGDDDEGIEPDLRQLVFASVHASAENCTVEVGLATSSPVFDEFPDEPASRFPHTSPPTFTNTAPTASAAASAQINAISNSTLQVLSDLWTSVSEHGLSDALALASPRGARLRDEMHHLAAKQKSERAQLYADCPDYDDYMRCVQLDLLSPVHRRKVFEWNIELADMLKLSNQALLLGFAYFDRYLSLTPSRLTDLQLLSTACMWAASKVCSTECPVAKASQLATLFNGIEAGDVLRMEMKLFSVLKWRVHPTMSYDIVHLVLPCLSCDHPALHLKLTQLTENILLTVALVYPMMKFDPLVLAVTAVACACELVAAVPLETLGILGRLSALVGADMQSTEECIRMLRKHVRLDRLSPAKQE